MLYLLLNVRRIDEKTVYACRSAYLQHEPAILPASSAALLSHFACVWWIPESIDVDAEAR